MIANNVLALLPSGGPARIAIFCVSSIWTPHFATELELFAEHRQRGDEVIMFVCDGDLPSCMPNPEHARHRCITCRSQAEVGFSAAGVDGSSIRSLRVSARVSSVELPEPSSIAELRAWTWEGHDIGEAAASSVISVLRDSDPDVDEHRELIQANLQSAVGLHLDAIEQLGEVAPDLVYVFNGRTSTTRPVIRACETLGLPYACHEVTYGLERYRVVLGGMVHDLELAKVDILRCWEESVLAPSERASLARDFFRGRRIGSKGGPVARYQFNRHQVAGSLPAGFDPGRRNVALFNSSEDEFAAIASYRNPVYRDQMDALEAILREPRLRDVQFYLRVHPNLMGVDNEQVQRVAALEGHPNLCLIRADQTVDTYALIDAVDAVITFGSTVGIEAVHAGTPSILIGRTVFEDLGCIRPANHDEVVRAVLLASEPEDPELALPYGYFNMAGGQPYVGFERRDYMHGTFNGVELAPRPQDQRRAELLRKSVWALENPADACRAALNKVRTLGRARPREPES